MTVKLVSVTPDAEKTMAYVARVSNPATDYFMVDWSRGSKMQLRVFNANGQMVLSQTVNRGATRVLVDEWTPGIYFVEATADGKSSVKKLLVR